MKKLLSLLAIGVLSLAGLVVGVKEAKAQTFPAAFVARLYTEALGRAPDPTGWKNAVLHFQSNGCNLAELELFAYGVLTSSEYLTRYSGANERIATMYRALFSRDPTSLQFTTWRDEILAQPSYYYTRLNSLITSSTFANFHTNPNGTCKTNLPWVASNVLGRGVGAGFSGTQAQLQALIDGGSDQTIYLRSGTTVQLTSPLYLRNNTRLATTGLPTFPEYAFMGRLVRASNFEGVMVDISAGSSLQSVWVSGRRESVGVGAGDYRQSANIRVTNANTATYVNNVRSDTPAGWSNIMAWGASELQACTGLQITSNLVLGYGSTPYADGQPAGLWVDGISYSCGDGIVAGNHIVDTTDNAIAIFRSVPGGQSSIIEENLIVQAGLPAIGGIGMEACPLPAGDCTIANSPAGYNPSNWTGVVVRNNILFTSPSAWMVFGLNVGSRPYHANGPQISGASVTGNTTSGVLSRFQTAILIDGALSTTVTGNTFDFSQLAPSPRANTCAVGKYTANTSAFASGTRQSGFVVAARVSGCT